MLLERRQLLFVLERGICVPAVVEIAVTLQALKELVNLVLVFRADVVAGTFVEEDLILASVHLSLIHTASEGATIAIILRWCLIL